MRAGFIGALAVVLLFTAAMFAQSSLSVPEPPTPAQMTQRAFDEIMRHLIYEEDSRDVRRQTRLI